MTESMTFVFEETDTPPPERRKGGPGRLRSNPFDEKVRQSYDDGWYESTEERPAGRWHTFKVPEPLRDKVYNQIRNAGTYQNLGTNIRVSDQADEDGMVTFAFRGKPPDDRARGNNGGGVQSMNENDMNETDTDVDMPMQRESYD